MHSCQFLFLSVTLPGVLGRSARCLGDLESQQRGWEAPYLAFEKACRSGRTGASPAAGAAVRSLASVSKAAVSEKLALEPEQWVEGEIWLLMLGSSWGARFDSLGLAVGSSCLASYHNCAAGPRAAVENCPCCLQNRAYLV